MQHNLVGLTDGTTAKPQASYQTYSGDFSLSMILFFCGHFAHVDNLPADCCHYEMLIMFMFSVNLQYLI